MAYQKRLVRGKHLINELLDEKQKIESDLSSILDQKEALKFKSDISNNIYTQTGD